MVSLNSVVLSKNLVLSFNKILQKKGAKELSELIIRNLFCFIKKANKTNPLLLFKDALEKTKFYSEIKSIRIFGMLYKVPIEIKPKRQRNIILKTIVFNALKKDDLSVDACLMKEILDCCDLTSHSIKACDEFHKIAELNKIYILYRY